MANTVVDEEDELAKKDNDRWGERRNRLSGGALARGKGPSMGRYEGSTLDPNGDQNMGANTDSTDAANESTSSFIPS
eukprot:4978677-Alexandrium_andersonii.AAC.1